MKLETDPDYFRYGPVDIGHRLGFRDSRGPIAPTNSD